MKACAEATRPHAIKTIVSLNPIMVDGTGMCGGCRVKLGDEVKFACVDGPDFDGHKVDFDDLMMRLRRYRRAGEGRHAALVGELPHEGSDPIPTARDRRVLGCSSPHVGVGARALRGCPIRSNEVRGRLAIRRGRQHGQKANDTDHSAAAHADARAARAGAREELCRGGLRLPASRRRCKESERCLLCPDQPCIAGCPVGIDIPGFIQKLGEKDFRGAYDVLTATNLLPAICGRVCPQENQCEGVCTVGDTLEPVAIGRLERFVGDTAIAEGWANIPYIEPNGFRIGIVGSGPAGMACAADMAKAGCDVTVYEAFHQPGGVLRYGIPDFRLPNDGDRRRDRQPAQARRQVRVQHAGRPPVHDRADDRRDGLRRRLHRHRRRLSDDARHSRRFAQRRAVGQRAADALQSDARQGISRTTTRRCRSAGAWR